MEASKKKNTIILYLIAGALCVVIFYLPYFILGQDATYMILDFLDDEVVHYLHNGKYLFAGPNTIIEEWLGGAPSATIQAPCFLPILFYQILPTWLAIPAVMVFSSFFGFLGMFLLCNELLEGKQKYLSFGASLLFIILPFYSSYALSSIGIPLVVWACIKLCRKKAPENTDNKRKAILSDLPYYLIFVLYALSSSFALVGYFVVGFLFLAAFILLLKKDKNWWKILIGACLVTLLYCFTFRNTIINMLFETYVSHRSDAERVYSVIDFKHSFIEMFKYGHPHASSLHTYVMAFSLVASLLGLIFFIPLDKSSRKRVILSVMLWLGALFIAFFFAFYSCETGLALRKYLGPLESFQLDRFYWMYPGIWYVEYALSISVFFSVTKIILKWITSRIPFIKEKISGKVKRILFTVFEIVFVCCFTLYMGHYIINHFHNDPYYSNLQQLQGVDTDCWTYREFYDHALFDEIKEYIGKDVSEYRIGCFAFVPAIAQVNGFYTIDGYCTNYPLEYKEQFRKIFAKEIDKSEVLHAYYDNWGNRCYIFSAELGLKFQTGKGEKVTVKNLELDTDALKELNCDYIFSAVKIKNASETGLHFLEVFTTEQSQIEIYVYEIL